MVKITVGDLHCHIDADGGLLSFLARNLRSENDYLARKRSEEAVRQGWSKRVIPKYQYFIDKKGKFLTGFLPRVVGLLKRKGVEVVLEDNRVITEMPDLEEVRILINSMEIDGKALSLRDYQIDALVSGLQKTRGVFDLATGAGKTLVMAALMLAWRKKTLVVINSKDLAYQLQDEIADYTQMPVGFIGDGIWSPKDFTVAIDRSLVTRKAGKEFLSTIEYLIYDEVHHIQSKTWRSIARQAKNASIRHGFTGTPQTSEKRTEDRGVTDNNMMIEGYLGPTISQVKTRDLINLGYLADCEVFMVENELYFDGEPLPYGEEYRRIIIKDDERNRIIAKIFYDGFVAGEQVIGFVDRIEHGDEIRRLLVEEHGVPDEQVLYVHGTSYSREADLERFKNKEAQILFGTVLSEGLNFICDRGVLISGGKSSKDLRQRIGRILRKPRLDTGDVDKGDGRFVKFFDCCDLGHPYFSSHARNREKTYREDGYQVIKLKAEEVWNAEG